MGSFFFSKVEGEEVEGENREEDEFREMAVSEEERNERDLEGKGGEEVSGEGSRERRDSRD